MWNSTIKLTVAFSVAIVWVLPCAGPTVAQSATDWATGKVLEERLAQQVSVLWSDNPLRQSLESLTTTQRVALLIDRRVDPGQKITLNTSSSSLAAVLQKVAESCGLGISRLGSAVYIGPPKAAKRLVPAATAFDRAARRLPSAVKVKFLRQKPISWQALSTPRDLLTQLAEENSLKLLGLDRVPHDLWAAADLPPLSLVDRLCLIAIQFDLTFTVADNGRTIELIPLPDDLPRLKHPPLNPQERHPSQSQPVDVGRLRIERISIKDEPLGPVLRQLAGKLNLELRINEEGIKAKGVSLDRNVSINLRQASVDELLEQLLAPVGLKATRRGRVVEIRPAGQAED